MSFDGVAKHSTSHEAVDPQLETMKYDCWEIDLSIIMKILIPQGIQE